MTSLLLATSLIPFPHISVAPVEYHLAYGNHVL